MICKLIIQRLHFNLMCIFCSNMYNVITHYNVSQIKQFNMCKYQLNYYVALETKKGIQ